MLPAEYSGKILRRIPKGARQMAAKYFNKLLERVVEDKSFNSWSDLIWFARRCLTVPSRRGKSSPSLATYVKKCITLAEQSPQLPLNLTNEPVGNTNKRKYTTKSAQRDISKLVSEKLSEFDIKGAIRVLTSDDKVAP